MDEELLELSHKLKEAINKDPRVIALNKIEEEMNNSHEVTKLAIIKEQKVEDYNFMCSHFKDDSPQVIKARQELAKAKEELETHPLVKEYLVRFKAVREMNEKINKELFAFINKDLCKGSK